MCGGLKGRKLGRLKGDAVRGMIFTFCGVEYRWRELPNRRDLPDRRDLPNRQELRKRTAPPKCRNDQNLRDLAIAGADLYRGGLCTRSLAWEHRCFRLRRRSARTRLDDRRVDERRLMRRRPADS